MNNPQVSVLMPAYTIESIFNQTFKKFTGDLEMLVVADTLGFKRIFEAPIKLDYSLGPLLSAATIKSIFSIMKDTFAIWYRKNILHYYK